jgi:hypothetical protein
MMKRIQIVKKLLIICCVAILLIIPWASVFGIKDPGLLDAANIFQGSAFLVIVTAMVVKLIHQIYYKPLAQDMAEEESKEADQKDTKQLLFKPATRGSIIYILFISLPVLFIITQFIPPPKVDLGETIAAIGMIVLFLWLWNTLTVFIFAEDSVQIKPYLFYLLGINIKTVVRYEDITSVSPDAKIKDNMYGRDNKYRIVITTNETTQGYSLVHYDKDIVAKLYLRFQEKLGDKVTLE